MTYPFPFPIKLSFNILPWWIFEKYFNIEHLRSLRWYQLSKIMVEQRTNYFSQLWANIFSTSPIKFSMHFINIFSNPRPDNIWIFLKDGQNWFLTLTLNNSFLFFGPFVIKFEDLRKFVNINKSTSKKINRKKKHNQSNTTKHFSLRGVAKSFYHI